MDVKINGLDDLQRIGREHPKAAARALNRTMTHARSEMARDVRARYKAKSADVKRAMGSTKLATAKRLSTYFRSGGKRIALTYFMTASAMADSIRQAGRKITRRGKVKFELTKGRKRTMPGAFVAHMESGHVGVFVRGSGKMKKDPRKQSIEERTGPAVPQMLSGTFSRMRGLHDYLRKQIEHEIKWLMQGKGPT